MGLISQEAESLFTDVFNAATISRDLLPYPVDTLSMITAWSDLFVLEDRDKRGGFFFFNAVLLKVV